MYEGKRGRKLVSPPKMYPLLKNIFSYHNRSEISKRKKKLNFIKVNEVGGAGGETVIDVKSSVDGSQKYMLVKFDY